MWKGCPQSGQSFKKNAKQFTSSQVFGKNIRFYEINKDLTQKTNHHEQRIKRCYLHTKR